MLRESTGNRTSIEFRNGDDRRLVGMYYHAAGDTVRDVAVVIPVNSVKYRAGSFRYHYLLADKLTRLGYPVFCFDPACIGDSEGALARQRVEATFIEIQNGAHVADTRLALDTMRERFGHERFLLCGLCGGAITAAMTTAADERVVAAVLLGIPILRDRDPAAKAPPPRAGSEAAVSDRWALGVLRRKAAALGDVQVWKKLLRGGYRDGKEFQEVTRSLRSLAGNLGRRLTSRRQAATLQDLLEAPLSDRDRYNLNLQRALVRAWLRGVKLHFVFGSLDPVTGQFEDAFLEPANDRVAGLADLYEHVVIENANHIFSATDSQEKLDEIVLGWITRY